LLATGANLRTALMSGVATDRMIVTGHVLSGVLAGALFKQVWRMLAHEQEAPAATERQRSWTEVVAAAAIQGAVFGGVKALVDRAGAAGFERVTGVWPGGNGTDEK